MRREYLLLRHDPILPSISEILMHQLAIIPLPNHDILNDPSLTLLQVNIIQRRISKHRELITNPLIGSLIKPFMLLAMAFKFPLQPGVNGPVMKLNVMVKG